MDKKSLLFVFLLTTTLLSINLFFDQKRADRVLEHTQEQKTDKIIADQNPINKENINTISTEEDFYVLENDLQQFVFSSRGGALAEINLTFSDDDNSTPVKEIEVDREIAEKSKENNLFPLKNYYANGNVDVKSENKVGGYYPLLRRKLSDQSGNIQAKNYALNIVSDYPEMAEIKYKVKEFTNDKIIFEARQAHRTITKTYQLPKNEAPYCLDVTIDIQGSSNGLWLTSGVPEAEIISGRPAPVLKYRILRGDKKTEVEKISLPKTEVIATTMRPDWLCNSNGFFGLIIDPISKVGAGYKAEKITGENLPSRLIEVGKIHNKYKAKDYPGYNILLPLAGQNNSTNFRFYAGPFNEKTLKLVDKIYSDKETNYTTSYIDCQSVHGWFSFISGPFSKFLSVIMNLFYSITNSWTLSIVLVTVVLRMLLFPLNSWSMQSMRKMQKIGPKVSAIQAKYKKDPKKAQTEVMLLYKKHKVNPLSGCFPMLIQMPFLIGMFDLLKSSFVLRGATFIPGWIDNLTSPDVLFSWQTSLPFFGTEFHILPVILGLVMFLQQKFSSTLPKDKNEWTEQQKQQGMMSKFMTIFFTIMFYNFPAGLNIYWLSSMLLSLAQQWFTNKRLDSLENNPLEVMKK